MRPGVVDQNPSHYLRRHPEKVGAVLPLDTTLAYKANVRLVNECRRLEGVIRTFTPQIRDRLFSKLTIDERN
jgi:hypothetical protein